MVMPGPTGGWKIAIRRSGKRQEARSTLQFDADTPIRRRVLLVLPRDWPGEHMGRVPELSYSVSGAASQLRNLRTQEDSLVFRAGS